MMTLASGGNYGLNLLGEFFNDPFFTGSVKENSDSRKLPVMRTDTTEKDDDHIIEAELLGFEKRDTKVELKDGYLIIPTEHDTSGESKDDRGTVIRRERYTGSYKRTFPAGGHIRREDIKTGFENGTLKLWVPKDAPRVEETSKYIDILQSLPFLVLS